MNLRPDWVIDSPEGLIKLLTRDLNEWTAQLVMLNGGWLTKYTERTGLVTLDLTTHGKKEGLLKLESLIVESLESMSAEVTIGENQRSHNGHTQKSWIFYRMPKG